MEKGLGIAALALAIIAVFTALVGPWLTVVAALIAMFAVGPGFGMAIGAIIINFINLLFLSPTTWLYLSSDAAIIGLIWLGAQVLSLVVLVKRNKQYKPEVATLEESA